MKKTCLLILALCLACTPALALADSTMRVQGTATITVAPNMAILYVGYSGEQDDSSAAQQETAAVIHAIIAALEDAGIGEDDIATSYLNTYPVYNYTESGQTLRGYRVEHMLAITVRELDSVGDTLDIALDAGANQANSISYQSTREKDVYLQALALAVENASAKADALAIASGVWMGSLAQVNEMTSYGGVTRTSDVVAYAMDESSAGSLGGSIKTGDLEISASVELVYNIR